MTADGRYWFFFVLALVFSGWGEWDLVPRPYSTSSAAPSPTFSFSSLFFLVGIKVFGSPIR